MKNHKKLIFFFVLFGVSGNFFPGRAFADFKAGYEAFLKKDYPSALSLLSQSRPPKGHLLVDYYLWALGRSKIEQGDYEGGRQALEELLKTEPNSLLADPAKVQIARSLQAQGQSPKAVEYLSPLISAIQGDSKGEALFYLALAEADGGKKDSAQSYLKQVYFEYPSSSVASQVPALWQKIAGTPFSEGNSVERMARADRLFESKNFSKAAEVYASLESDSDPARRDLARLRRGESLYSLKRYSEALPLLSPGPSVDAATARAALLDLGMSRLRSGDESGAVSTFEEVQQRFPNTPQGEEALYREGMIAYQSGRRAEALGVFQRLVESYPHGSFRDKAVWAAAWAAFRQSDFSESLKWLKALQDGATDGATRGKALYWQGRIAERQGNAALAKQAFGQAAKEAPFSYYGFMALKKLKGSETLSQTPAVPAEWMPAPMVPAGGGSGAGRATAMLHFKKAEALFDAGLGRLSQAELEAALAAASEDTSAMASLLEAAKKTRAYFISGLFGQKYWDRFKGAFPSPEAAENFRTHLQYPFAYRHEVEKAGARNGVPAALVVGLMRQESGFMPWITSSANAQGLMQLLPATAAGRARALGLGAGDLFDPDYNIMVGSAELKAMIDRFGGDWTRALAGYNAGPGRAKQWNGEFGSLPVDEFVEEIPFSETNLYVKLVLRNYWTYQTLYK